MTNSNSKNDRIKREYFRYLRESNGKAESSIDAIRAAIHRYETFINFADFAKFDKDRVIEFKAYLTATKSHVTGKPLSNSTVHSTLNNLKAFHIWLSYRPEYQAKIKRPEANFFNPNNHIARVAKSSKYKIAPTLEQIRKVILSMPASTIFERRNRALVAFTILTGMRDGAIASIKIKHIDVERKLVTQDPEEVHTKFSKRIDTFFFPVGEDIEKIFLDWVQELKCELLYGFDAPVFPRTANGLNDEHCFVAKGLEPHHWSNATPIREVFKSAFLNAGIPYFNPHSFRNTLVIMGEQYCQNPEQFKAWSQNLGHEHVLTTFTSYGQVSPYRQGEIIRELKAGSGAVDAQKKQMIEEIYKAVVERGAI